MKSWIEIKADSDFSLHNIPFGIGVIPGSGPRICTRIGDKVVDLSIMANNAYFDRSVFKDSDFVASELNNFISKGKQATGKVRSAIIECFLEKNYNESEAGFISDFMLYDASDIQMLLPVRIGDYTDFYSSIEHATNVGVMFRDPSNALLPNWRHIPVGYHGRSSSIVVSVLSEWSCFALAGSFK